jgi:hypothetical protein
LRYIRDNVLGKTPEGQALVTLYYQWSPIVVKAMEGNGGVKQRVKKTIDDILLLVR